jgi:hypothetical protein
MYTSVTDFRGGLDSRKMSLALPAGTLIQCDNAHINQGAEIEKRKAYVQNAIPYSATFPTFGACATPLGISIFGSGSLAAGVAPNSVTPGAYPSPMVYQMLIHPAVLAGTGYAQGTHNMTAALHSALFGNFPFVIAKFADGGIYCYYNGVLVADYTSGVVLAFLAGNNAGMATAIATLVNNSNNYTGTASGTNIDVFSNPGNSYSATAIVESFSNMTVATSSNLNYTTATVTYNNGSTSLGNNSPDGSTVEIGGQIYRFKNVMAAAFDVQIGLTYVQTTQNLFLAVNASGVSGTNYFAGTTKNTNVVASLFISTPNPTFTLTALALNTPGETQNNITGVGLTLTAASVNKTTGAQSQGQFRIVAGVPSTAATGTITNAGSVPVDGSTIKVGAITYRFKNVMAQAYDIAIGSAILTFANLNRAINGSGTPGFNYYAGTLPNPGVAATSALPVLVSGSTYNIPLVAIASGAGGNGLVLTLSGTTNLTVSAATLTGGVTSGISAVTIGPLYASCSITSNGANPSNGDTLTIGATVYTFKTVLSTEGDILIGITTSDTIQNLIEAINLTGVYLENYQVSNLNQQVTALASTQGGVIKIIARGAGAAGNAIALASSSAKLVAPATLTGGADTLALLSAPVNWASTSTVTQFSNAMAAGINASTGATGFYAKNESQVIYIYSVGYNSFGDNAVVSVTSGGVAIGFCGLGFTVSKKGAGTGSINQININGVNTMTGPLSLSSYTSLNALVAAVAASINANTAVGPDGSTPLNQVWQAIPIGSILYLSNIVTSSNDIPQVITATTDGVYIGVTQVGNFALEGIVSPTFIGFTRINNVTANNSPIAATCEASGGYPPYAYNWQRQAGDTGFQVSDSSKQSVTFSRQDSAGSQNSTWACIVTDSQGNSSTSNTVIVSQP